MATIAKLYVVGLSVFSAVLVIDLVRYILQTTHLQSIAMLSGSIVFIGVTVWLATYLSKR